MEEIRDIFDRTFKRIFSLSNNAILSLVNGLFGTNHPPGSTVVYANRESTNATLKHHYADVFLLVNGQFHYHLEAQMTYSNDIILRVFEYGFYHALESHTDGSLHLKFPEPVVIYLADRDDIPPESTLHIDFQGQASVDYRVRNFVYLRHSLEELEQKKLIILIPFQALRVRALLYDSRGRLKYPEKEEFEQLLRIVESDIIAAIEANLSAGNITPADAVELLSLTKNLYAQIILHYQNRGGDQDMRPLLPGAIRLPEDEFIFHAREVEEKYVAVSRENAALTEENQKLKARIRELEAAATK